MFSRFFIDRPIFAAVLSIVITLAGGIAVFSLAARAVSVGSRRRPCRCTCTYPGASAKDVAEAVAAPIEQQVNGVEGMMYMSSQCTNDGSYNLTVTFRTRRRPEHGPGAGAEPRQPGHAAAARRHQANRRDDAQALARHSDGHRARTRRTAATISST